MGFQIFNFENEASCVHSKTRDWGMVKMYKRKRIVDVKKGDICKVVRIVNCSSLLCRDSFSKERWENRGGKRREGRMNNFTSLLPSLCVLSFHLSPFSCQNKMKEASTETFETVTDRSTNILTGNNWHYKVVNRFLTCKKCNVLVISALDTRLSRLEER